MPAHGKYKSAAAIAAINIPKETFNRWLDRRVILLATDDIPGDGRGKPRWFGLRTMTKLAVAHQISLLGIPANIAVTLAAKFTDEPQHGRLIGGLFPVGKTVLLITSGGTGAVKNIQPDGYLDSHLTTESAIVVDIGKIVLNLHERIASLR